jgi:FeS assembly protein IscX
MNTSAGLKWVDSLEIALDLLELYPDVNPLTINFTDLRVWVLELERFNDDPAHCGERVLEAIQLAWIDEVD